MNKNPLQEVDCAGSLTTLRSVLIHRPDAHPFWHTYMMSLIHLRPVEGMEAAVLSAPTASHEILVLALDPKSQPDPKDPSKIAWMQPANLAHQLHNRDDATALVIFNAFVKAVDSGELSPDTDFRRSQLSWFERWEKSC